MVRTVKEKRIKKDRIDLDKYDVFEREAKLSGNGAIINFLKKYAGHKVYVLVKKLKK